MDYPRYRGNPARPHATPPIRFWTPAVRSRFAALLTANRQFLLYCLIGLSGVTFDFLVYAALVRFLDLHIH